MADTESLESFLEAVARQSWDEFRGQALTYVLAGVISVLISILSLGILAPSMMVGFLGLVRRHRTGVPIQAVDVFKGLSKLAPSLIAAIIVGIGVLVGWLLLVLPGILFAVFAVFTFHAITYEDLSSVDAISRSFSLVRAHFVEVLVLLVALAALQGGGSAVLFGVLLTHPLALIASCVAFERIAAGGPERFGAASSS